VEGEHVLALDIGLPLGELRGDLKAAVSGQAERVERVLDAINRRGQALRCRVTIVPLGAPNDAADTGALIMMEPLPV
jgi:two-component system CheB/CheR fusion protein